MGPLADATLARLRADAALAAAYRSAFPEARELVTWEQTALALAAAVRSIPPPPSAFEHYLAGDRAVLGPAAMRGRALFAELGCQACHRPPSFASASYHSVGLPADPARNGGRARVPSLRGVAWTAPYFHDGSAATLAEVVRHYARGGGPGASPALTPLMLTDEDVEALVAFLKSL
jgi:cytochrome c peroxidase